MQSNDMQPKVPPAHIPPVVDAIEAAPLRYNIKTRLAAYGERERVMIKKRVISRTNISESSYSRYINCRKDEGTDVPGEVLKEFATAFIVSIEDLFNE